MPAAGGGEPLSPSSSRGAGFPVHTMTPDSASWDPACALPLSLLLRAPSSTPELALERAGRGRSLCCCPRCCLHWDVAPSAKPARFSSVSKSRYAAGCSWLRCLVRAAPNVMLAQVRSGPWVRAGPCPQAAQSPGWVLAMTPATQLPYKPWNVTASPVLLTLSSWHGGCFSKDGFACGTKCCVGACPWHVHLSWRVRASAAPQHGAQTPGILYKAGVAGAAAPGPADLCRARRDGFSEFIL